MVKRKYRKYTKKQRRFSRKQKGGTQNPMKYAIMAIFKNEAMGIAEWVEHYVWQ